MGAPLIFFVFLFLLTVGCMFVALYHPDKGERVWATFFALVLLIASTIAAMTNSYGWGQGRLVAAKEKLDMGDTYTLLTECVKISKEDSGEREDCYCVILKTDNGKVRSLYVKNPIPKRGVVTKDQNGEMTFLPLSEPASPVEKPVEKPTEKPVEKK